LEAEEALRAVCKTLNKLGRFSECELLFNQYVCDIESKHFDNKSRLKNLYGTFAKLLKEQNKIDEAIKYYLREIEIIKDSDGPESAFLITPLRTLGAILRNANRLDEAEYFLEKALDLAEKNQVNTGDEINRELYALGRLRLLQTRNQESEELFLRCLEIENSIGNQEDIDMTKEQLVELYQAWGRTEEAAKYQN
jgi:tetratricopeptide (TPR) repeat protein